MTTPADLTQLASTLARFAEALAAREVEPPAPVSRPLPPRVLLTVEEAAAQLGIGRTTAFGLVASGELESVRIGRLRRVHVSAITEYAATLVEIERKTA